MCGGDKLKTGGRSGAIDMVRVLAMLAIIKEHSSLNEPFWHIYGAFLSAGAGVVFFFFAAALFLKSDASAVYKRSGWLLACYIFWGVMAWWLLSPIAAHLAQCISGEGGEFSFPSLVSMPLSKIILWDWTQTFPNAGILWFIRLLLLFTLISPLLQRLPVWVLVIIGCVFWGIRYTELVSSPEYKKWLPFILTAQWPAASVALYMFGLAVKKAGGIKLFLKYGQRLYLVAAVICVLGLTFVFTGYRGFIAADVGILVPFALCSLLIWFERFSLVRKLGGLISRLAPCVFSVYILHGFLNPVVFAAGMAWFEGAALRAFCILMPVLVFFLCWLMYLLMVRIPHCSMLLCFVPRRKV